MSGKKRSRNLIKKQKTQHRLKLNLLRNRAKGKKGAKPVDEAAEAEAPWQDQYVQKVFRVVREFEGGQNAYGFVGLCVQASCFEANERSLLLVGSDHKENVSWHYVLHECCSEVEEAVRQPRPLFSFARIGFEQKVSMLFRYGMRDVLVSGPFEKVLAHNFKPEGWHIPL